MHKVFEFPSWPHFEADERDAVLAVLDSGKVNYWTGEVCRKFESDYAVYTGRRHGIALHNGTLALELALYAFNIGPGDEVITTPRTFIASASTIVMRGAKPIFAELDSETQNITKESVEKVLTSRTRAIITVHLGGWPCDMESIMELAYSRGLLVIEDCAQAHGAAYKKKPVGSFGHAAAFSFCQDKIITTGGEGGMLVLDDDNAWMRAWAYKDHGKSYEAVYNRMHPPGFRWLHESFGTNGRMLEAQAAIGRIQLRKLPEWNSIRSRNAGILYGHLKNLPALRTPWPGDYIKHAFYRFYVFVRPEMLKPDWSRDRIMNAIVELGIPCSVGSCSEVYLEKAFTDACLQPEERLPMAKRLGETSLAFLVHPTLTKENMEDMSETVYEVVSKATK